MRRRLFSYWYVPRNENHAGQRLCGVHGTKGFLFGRAFIRELESFFVLVGLLASEF